MKLRKLICILLVVSAIMCCMSPSAVAVNGNENESAGVYSTASIRFDVQPQSSAISRNIMSLDVGEKVVITAGYTPFSASLEVGILDSDDQFYYMVFTGGNVDMEITITKRGNYRLAVYNTSANTVSMSGYVNY